MTTEQMRQALLKAYPHSKAWSARVKSMSDSQIFAIYTRLKLKGAIK